MTVTKTLVKKITDMNVGDLTLLPNLTKASDVPEKKSKDIFIQRGNKLTIITRNIPKIKHSADANAEKKL